MNFFPDFKTIVTFGGFQITWYAVFILGGALLAYNFAVKKLTKKGFDQTIFENYFFYMLPLAIIGARLYYVIFEWSQYQNNLIKIFYIWEGGLAIHGGLIAAILFGLYYFRKYNVNVLLVMDVAFPFLMIAQAIGRIGNFMNQEAYGGIVSAGFYQGWPSFIKDHMFIDGSYRLPTFLFESIGNLIGFVLIYFIFRKYGARKRGDIAFAYAAWYGTLRFLIEGMRSDSLMIGGLRVAQIVSIIMVSVGLLGILGLFDKLFRKSWIFKKNQPVILFDLDGTLIDTQALIFESFIYTFKAMGNNLELSNELLTTFMGPPLETTFGLYFNEEEANKACSIYRDYTIEHHNSVVKAIPQALESIEQLKLAGFDLGVVSNKRHDIVMMGLVACGFDKYIDCVVCVDDEGVRPKPSSSGILKALKILNRSSNDVIYIGDCGTDIDAAKNMGAYSIAYASDEFVANQLANKKPCATISQMKDLLKIVQEEKAWSDVTI